MSDNASPTTRHRVEMLDIARGVALVAMAVYHFTWDLEFFGYTPGGMTAVGGWKIFARSIASTFLFLVGVSLFLAHAKGVRWPPFWRRFALVAASALAISLVTWFATPDTFIFFGILHQIAFASLAGLLFLRLPSLLTLAIGIAIIVLSYVVATPLLDNPAGWWIGLAEARPRSSDFVPVFPWFGVVLIGIAAGGLAVRSGLMGWLAAVAPGRWSQPFSFIGRHSLAFYLIHQPVLISIVWLAAQVVPPSAALQQSNFTASCQRACSAERSAAFCEVYCSCMREGLFSSTSARLAPRDTPEFRQQLSEQVLLCTSSTEIIVPEGEDRDD